MTLLRQRFLADMKLRGLSERSQQAYQRAVRQLAEYFRRSPDQLSEEDLRNYFLYLVEEKQFAAGTLKVAFSGIKWFFTHTVPRDWELLRTFRLPKQVSLPVVLSVEEVRRLFAAVRTEHNRIYFQTVYALGLRMQETLNLEVGDILSDRMQVHVRLGKGGRDRYVPLPTTALTRLRTYWTTHRHPRFLFPALGRGKQNAATADRPMHPSSVQGAMTQVVRELGLRPGVSIHTLRHCYATHLLEVGVNLTTIQKYLGHTSLQHTVKYLHLTNQGEELAREKLEALMAD